MPKRRTPLSTDYPFHITARANNREPFPADLEFIWKTLTGEIFIQHVQFGIRVHGFVLMPNHFHLLVTSPLRPIGSFMRDFLGPSTKIINARTQRTGHLTGGPYFGSMITDPTYFLHAYRYVIRNPVRAGLSAHAGDYSFSTYNRWLGFGHLPFPIFAPAWDLDRWLPQDVESMDAWLNQPTAAEEVERIRRGLRKRTFKLPVNRSTRKQESISL